jgi:hypothetical protein
MTYKDINTRHAPAIAGQLHSPRLPRPTATLQPPGPEGSGSQAEHGVMPCCGPLRPKRLGRSPERGCSQGWRLGLNPAQTPPHTPRARQPAQLALPVSGGELLLVEQPLTAELPVVAAATRGEFTCEAWLDDAVGISQWRGRRSPVGPPCQVHRETFSQAPAHETASAGTGAGLPGRLLQIPFCDDEYQPSVGVEPCRVVDIDRVRQRDVPAECGRQREAGRRSRPGSPPEEELFAVTADGLCWTRPPAAAGRRPRPKVCASPRVTLPQGPVVGRTLLWTAAEALRAPGERWKHAWGGRTRCAAGAPAPTAAAQEQAARIAEAGMKADAFEGVA